MMKRYPFAGAVARSIAGRPGAAGVNSPEWLTRLDPQLVLLSVGANDTRGLPDPEVMEALEGYNLLRTDRDGWIEIDTDGEQMWVEVEKVELFRIKFRPHYTRPEWNLFSVSGVYSNR